LARREGAGEYSDISDFCRSTTLEEIRSHNYILTPGRFVGAANTEEDAVVVEDQFAALKQKLTEQSAEFDELSALIKKKLEEIDFNG